MVQDETEDAIDDARPKVRYLLFAGVAGACLLGAGLGLWARPALSERGVAKAEEPAEEAPAGSRKLQIVFDDTPAPIGKPMEVMAPHPAAAAAPQVIVPRLPSAPPAGLVQVDAPRPAPVALPDKPAILPERRPALRPRPAIAEASPPPPAAAAPAIHAPAIHLTALLASAEAVLVRIAHARPSPAPVQVASADESPKLDATAPRNSKAHHAKAARAHADAATRAAQAQAAEDARAERRAALEERRAERVAAAKAKAEKLARAERARKAHQAELAEAKAEARRQARQEARAEAAAQARADERAQERAEAAAEAHRKSRLAQLAHAIVRIAPHHAHPQPKLADQPAPKPAAHPPIHGSGPIRLASATRCVSPDPGEALACADPTLSAAERRMNRAYQQAEAAGVPPAELKKQQQRWIAARAAAAREAPWAVRDVYQARIAELEDMARTNPQN